MRRRQEMEREAAATFMSKKAADTGAGATGGGSTLRLDELTPAGRMTRQNTADDRAVNKAEVTEKQKLRFVSQLYNAA